MNDCTIKDAALIKIVQMLETGEDFAKAAQHIIVYMQSYINTSHAALLQVGYDGVSINKVVDYCRPGEQKLILDTLKIDGYVFSDSVVCCESENAAYKESIILDMLGVKSCVIVPIFINDVCAMYLTVFDAHSCIKFDSDKLGFITCTAKVLQSIAQKRVSKNTLFTSYDVLREILGSTGAGVMVFDYTDSSVLFQNSIAQNIQEIRRIIRECMEEYIEDLDENDILSIKSRRKKRARYVKPMERYDAQSGLWFQVKFCDLEWIDGRDVFVCTAVDITQQKKNQQRIEYQANNDFLTGLYNRMKCENDIRNVISEALKDNKRGAVMFIDLDDFKRINDGLGHQYGDVLLQQISAGLQSVPGMRGNAYRMGGDEFLLIIKPDFYPKMQRVISNILSMFNRPWNLSGVECFCTMSMGIAVYPDDAVEVHEIIKLADMAMYESKKTGKNRYTFYKSNETDDTVKLLDIENNMRQAVASQINEFVVFYQPVIDAYSRECVSCEALVRWNSKALGLMAPGEFIPLAEYLGLITHIGDYVLEAACIQCRKWNERGYPDICINVNLSVVQLMQKDVVENIKHIIKKTGVNSKNIVLEITESFAINDMERVIEIIDGLKEAGLRMALDDFGTGYSSLNYIKKLPLDVIKVDKTFIDDIVYDEYAQAFVKLIVDLSKTIGTQIVVEGVEQKEQYDMLKELGVNYIQGFLFGKPIPAYEFENKYLKKNDY